MTALPERLEYISSASSAANGTRVSVELKSLTLRHTWTTTMSSSATRETVHVEYCREGIVGHGEGAPIIRYAETPREALQAISRILPLIAESDPWKFTPLLAAVRQALGAHQRAASAAVEIAICDWLGKKLGVPLYRYFGLDPEGAPATNFSIGIDTPAVTRQKTEEADMYPILKVKVGLATDEETIQAVRSVTNKPLRVDANEGWTDKEEAIRKINWMEAQGVELIEQPMPAHMLDETRYVRGKVHIPIIADEACTDHAAIPRLQNSYDGINVKLDKSGGIMEAYRWVATARALDMKVMLGCMISSSCSCTAAAQLSPLADYCDLDGSLLISNDPYHGLEMEDGKLILPHGAGLGLERRDRR